MSLFWYSRKMFFLKWHQLHPEQRGAGWRWGAQVWQKIYAAAAVPHSESLEAELWQWIICRKSEFTHPEPTCGKLWVGPWEGLFSFGSMSLLWGNQGSESAVNPTVKSVWESKKKSLSCQMEWIRNMRQMQYKYVSITLLILKKKVYSTKENTIQLHQIQSDQY